jgi:hypothetical protein
MKNDERFWERVHLALDELRDPLEDESVQDAIAAQPELLEAWLTLRARLDALPFPRARRPALRLATAAAIVIAIGSIAFAVLRPRAAPIDDHTASTVPRAAPMESDTARVAADVEQAHGADASFATSEIVAFELSITVERPGERCTYVADRCRTRRTHERVGDPYEHSAITAETLNTRGE